MYKIYEIRNRFLRIQWLFMIVSLLSVSAMRLEGSTALLLIVSLWNTASFSYIFMMELRYSRDFHPIMIFELVNVLFVGISGISEFATYIADGELRVSDYIYTDSVGLGVLLVSLCSLLVITVFYFYDKRWQKRIDYSTPLVTYVKGCGINYLKYGLVTYVIVWIFRIINIIFPLANIASVLAEFVNIGQLMALLFLVFGMLKGIGGQKCARWHWIILFIEELLALRTGMKESIIQCFIPYAVYLTLSYDQISMAKKKTIIANALFLGLIVVFFVFPYVNIFRAQAINKGVEWSEVSVTDAMSEYFDYITSSGKYVKGYDKPENSIDAVVTRSSSIGLNSSGIDYCRKYGPERIYLYSCGISVIPRVVWPDKPVVVLGGQIDNVFRGGSVIDDVEMGGNSMTFGLVGSCFFAIGLWGAVLMSFIVAFLITYTWRIIKPNLYHSVIASWVFISLIRVLLKNFEHLYDCGFSFVIMSLIYLAIMKIFIKEKKEIQR